jgi:hypothetical protein
VGGVIILVVVSLSLGGTEAAKPALYAALAVWAVVLCFVVRASARGGRAGPKPAPRWSRVVELIATNLAFALVLAELALGGYAVCCGSSLLLADTLDSYKLTPGQTYGDGLRGNKLGYPGPDWEIAQQPGIRRIAALGDSFAVGSAVAFSENYLTLVGQELPASEVLNFGVSGTGPREYAAILHQDVWAFHPDVVLVSVFIGNDITEVMATPRHLDPRRYSLYLALTRGWRLARERCRLERAGDVPREAARAMMPMSLQSFREIEARRLVVCQVPPPAGMEKKWQRVFASLERIDADCRARAVPLALVLIPDEFQVNAEVLAEAMGDLQWAQSAVDLDLPQRRLRAFCAERGIACLDLKPHFEGVAGTYAPHDTHWNARGNRLAAAVLIPWLQKTGAMRPTYGAPLR